MIITKKILIFEGIDQSGKSALRKELLKLYPNQVTIDRLFISNLVYDDFFKRDKKDWNFLGNIIGRLQHITVIIYVYCDYITYVKRCTKDMHELLYEDEFKLQTKLFKFHLKKLDMSVISIDSSKDSPKKLALKLVRELEKYD